MTLARDKTLRFRLSESYSREQLLRDLLDMSDEIEKRLKAIEDRLTAGGL